MALAIKSWWGKLKRNHLLLMVICCVIPLLLVAGAVYFLGWSKSYLFWTVLLLCPITHYFMMKNMHGDKKDEENQKCH